jgi:hypothetical protein
VSAITLTLAIAFILLASNFVVINAQQQQQQLTSQPGGTNNGAFATATPQTTPLNIFQSKNDSFRVQVPQSWIIDDVNNTVPAPPEETRLGYEMLAQLCPEEEEIQPTFPNVNSSSASISDCVASLDEVIHVIRYPDLDSGLIQTANNATVYHLQKLQEVGYTGIQIVNSTNITVNLTMSQENQTVTTVPAKFVEMLYTITSAPDEVRRGYFILTATNATSPNLGVTKGYSVFYEDNSNDTTSATAVPEITRTTAAASAGSLASVPLPLPVKQVFDSFELIVAPEVEQAIKQQQASVGQTGTGATTSTTTTVGGSGVDGACDSSYPDNCIPPAPPDLDCVDVGITNFRVLSPDPHDFDRNNDGVGCERGSSGVPEDSAEDIDDDGGGDTSCHPSYPDTCIPPPPPNLNCGDIGDTDFEVVGSDPHGFDGDDDGIGCESGSGVPDDDGGDDDGGELEPEPEPEPGPGDGDGGGGEDGDGDGGGGEDGDGDGGGGEDGDGDGGGGEDGDGDIDG